MLFPLFCTSQQRAFSCLVRMESELLLPIKVSSALQVENFVLLSFSCEDVPLTFVNLRASFEGVGDQGNSFAAMLQSFLLAALCLG